MDKKIKVLMIGDHQLSTSGIANQSRLVAEALLKSGKFSIYALGGAIKHQNYDVVKSDVYGDDWKIQPVDGYGDPELIRKLLNSERPDILWFMSDPRFYGWLTDMDNEIRSKIPMVWLGIWDNFPEPKFLKHYFESIDVICTISNLTDQVVKKVNPRNTEIHRMPHTVDPSFFYKMPEAEIEDFKRKTFKNGQLDDKFVFLYNSRNARRKHPASTIICFKKFLDIVGHDKAVLLMHTDVRDPNGFDLEAIINDFDLNKGQVLFSTEKVPPHVMKYVYNLADCTIQISDAEGWSVPLTESLNCEKPVICTMTGGMQEQIFDGERFFGVGLKPASRMIVGNLSDAHYIYEDRVSEEEVVDAMLKMYLMPKEQREELGKLGKDHVQTNYNFDKINKRWVELMLDIHDRHGSWETRKYNKYICEAL